MFDSPYGIFIHSNPTPWYWALLSPLSIPIICPTPFYRCRTRCHVWFSPMTVEASTMLLYGWAPSNFFKLYTLEAFSHRHNETLSSFQDLSNTTQALMNTKVHSKICKCNECTHKLSLRTNTQEKRWLRASLLFYK